MTNLTMYHDPRLEGLVRPRTVGLAGGTSWVSTEWYYRKLNERVNQACGNLTSAVVKLDSLDFGRVNRYMELGDWGAITGILIKSIQDFQAVGVDMIAIASNTLHRVVPEALEQFESINLIHIGAVVAKKVASTEAKKVALLGTKETMQGDFISKFLVQQGIEVVVPSEANQDKLNRLIFDEYCHDHFNTATCSALYEMIARLCREEYIEGVILGCTELGEALNAEWRDLLINGHLDHDCELDARLEDPKLAESMRNFQIFDSAEIHVETIARYCIDGTL